MLVQNKIPAFWGYVPCASRDLTACRSVFKLNVTLFTLTPPPHTHTHPHSPPLTHTHTHTHTHTVSLPYDWWGRLWGMAHRAGQCNGWQGNHPLQLLWLLTREGVPLQVFGNHYEEVQPEAVCAETPGRNVCNYQARQPRRERGGWSQWGLVVSIIFICIVLHRCVDYSHYMYVDLNIHVRICRYCYKLKIFTTNFNY